MELTPEQIRKEIEAIVLKEDRVKEHYRIEALIREYGEQQREQGIVEGLKNVSDWATYNINGLKDNNENLIV